MNNYTLCPGSSDPFYTVATMCTGSSDPFYIASLIYTMGHYFLDTQYVRCN